MPGPNITVTIQAASDSFMTVNNTSGGAALGDDDCRKMYGLPHMFMASGYMQQHDGTRVGQSGGLDPNGNKVFYGTQFVINDSRSMTSVAEGGTGKLRHPAIDETPVTLRWDAIDAPSWGASGWGNAGVNKDFLSATYDITGGYGAGDSSVTLLQSYISSTPTHGFPINRRPTTTAFQLNCESIQHSIQDMSTITALPGIDYGDSGFTGTPEQLDNIAIAFGMRKETITLSGIMIDRGQISASNPRRQVILNIARSQYLKIRNAAPIADSKNETEGQYRSRGVQTQWGGVYAGPMNPRSYPCLTILGQGYDAADAGSAAGGDGVGTKGDVEADGGYRIYRGIIKSISWTMDPGRPDFWRWNMTFDTVANEKRANDLLFDAADVVGKDGEDAG